MLGEQLGRAAALGVAVVPLDGQRAQPALGVGERLAGDGDALLDRNDRDDASLGQRRPIVPLKRPWRRTAVGGARPRSTSRGHSRRS